MKTFVCKNCGATVRRPTPPLRCEACGQQRVGLFKPGDATSPIATPPLVPSPLQPSSHTAPPSPSLAVSRKTPPAPGDVLWRYLPSTQTHSKSLQPLRNCPAVDARGHIYVAAGNVLAAIADRDSSVEVLWEATLGGQIPGSPVVGADGRIRVHAGDGRLHCLNDQGAAAWTPVAVGEPLGWASPVVDGAGNTFVCAYAGGLLKIDPRGGREFGPFFRSRQKFDSTGLLRDGIFYVGSEDGYVFAIDLRESRGKSLWDHAAGLGKTTWFINSSPALGLDHSLIVAGRDEFLYGFQADGTQLWRLHIRGQMLASPAVDAAGDVYVGVSLLVRGMPAEGKLVCISGASRQVRWEYAAGGPVESTPVIGDDDIVYFGDNLGLVHAVRNNGQREWICQVGSPVRSAGTIVNPNRVLFGLDDGMLVALCCSSTSLAQGCLWPKYMGTPSNAQAAVT
jgi:outer membrane protein assembly factor BamB